MIEGKSVLALIPARGGSKGVPRKNIRLLGDRPLIAWTIEEAGKSRYIDRLILSSEDDEIIETARRWGCDVPFVRPAELSRDETPGIDPVLHALDALPQRYDIVVLLQPTSPFRTVEDIDACLERLLDAGAKCCVSMTEPEKNPYWMYRVGEGGTIAPLMEGVYLRRQDLPKVYAVNGAVYAADTAWLQETRSFLEPETVAYLMPRERSVDIDEEQDLLLCQALLSLRS